MNNIQEFNGLKILTGINTHSGSGTIQEHTHEINLFKTILSNVDNNINPLMIEIGCYWAIWSLLFKQKFNSGKNILIDLGKRQLLVGEKNFQINNFNYTSYHGGVFLKYSGTFKNSKQDLDYNKSENTDLLKFIPNINDDNPIGKEIDFLEIYKNERLDIIDILHLDIQGSELPFIESLTNLIDNKKIKNFVIGTNSEYIHNKLITFLSLSYNIIINEIYGSVGGDGFIYCKLK